MDEKTFQDFGHPTYHCIVVSAIPEAQSALAMANCGDAGSQA